jgi:SOS-response transcriptional repressor LexA
MPDLKSSSLYDRLMALKPEEMSRNAWTISAGVSRSALDDIRRNGRARHDTIEKLLGAIGLTFADLDRVVPNGTFAEVAPTGALTTQEVRTEFFGETPLTRLPVLGTAMGGDLIDTDMPIEMTELHQSQIIEYIQRPAALALDDQAYALEIVGDSMLPRFRPGERVAVSPRSPVRVGDDVIVQLRGPDGDGERIKLVLIKELVRRSGGYIELRQYNPDMTFRVQIERIAAIHKVRGIFF